MIANGWIGDGEQPLNLHHGLLGATFTPQLGYKFHSDSTEGILDAFRESFLFLLIF